LKITFLGTGTSQGVPVIACKCETCRSTNSKDHRLRSSVLIETNDSTIVIDAGPDFRQQLLRADVDKLDAILLSHEHRDHIAGLDDIRSFNYLQKKAMDIYAEERVQEGIKVNYSYVFSTIKYPGIPDMNLKTITNESFSINSTSILPIRALHLKLPVFGFRIKDFSYITDANFISEEELEKVDNSKILVINALRRKKHISHFNLEEALEIIEKTKPTKAYLTHISHLMGKYDDVSRKLPSNVFLAYDGLELST